MSHAMRAFFSTTVANNGNKLTCGRVRYVNIFWGEAGRGVNCSGNLLMGGGCAFSGLTGQETCWHLLQDSLETWFYLDFCAITLHRLGARLGWYVFFPSVGSFGGKMGCVLPCQPRGGGAHGSKRPLCYVFEFGPLVAFCSADMSRWLMLMTIVFHDNSPVTRHWNVPCQCAGFSWVCFWFVSIIDTLLSSILVQWGCVSSDIQSILLTQSNSNKSLILC